MFWFWLCQEREVKKKESVSGIRLFFWKIYCSTYILHSGVFLYLANSTSQSAAPRGGKIPLTTFHSVILKPDSVNLVKPPTTTIVKTIPAITNRYLATSGVVNGTSFAIVAVVEGADSVDCWKSNGRVAVVECAREEGDRRNDEKGFRNDANADKVADLDAI